ncbi:MAG: peptidyl-prolyl cis-trans isomerase [Sulfurimonas sp.]|nr:peptidyl-prolyl cis-trans isomerase [Sulfurimonas sp.]
MYKIFLTLIFASLLNAEIIDGVSVVVKEKAITLFDVKQEMALSNVDAKKASDILIRKALEEIEIQEKKLSVSSEEVYEDIKATAARNNLGVSEFYEAVRNANGLSSTELKEKVEEKLLSQKLYAAISYSAMNPPSESEVQEYYDLHQADFTHPSSFGVMIYTSKDQARLQEKIDNPMFYSPDITSMEQALPYEKISPELAALLEKTKLNSFTQIVPDGKGAFMSFYLKSVVSAKEGGIESVKNQIMNKIMEDQREQVLGDYFLRLRQNTDINIIRLP